MSFENKNLNTRPSSKIKAAIDNNNNFNKNKQILTNKRKIVTKSEELEKELAEAESYLEKANKDFMNFKTKEVKKENIHDDDAAIKFIEKTLEEKSILKKQSNSKISLQQFLKEKNLQEKSSLENVVISNTNSNTASVAFTNNNLENSNFDKNFFLSDSGVEKFEKSNREKNENLISKNFIQENNLMNRYRKQLRANGFPELGSLFCETENDQELLYKFFDYILIKKSNENGEKLKLKKTCEELKDKLIIQQNEHYKMEKEFQALKESYKKCERENKFLNDKCSRMKETHDKSILDLKSETHRYKTKLNFLQVEKKSLEEKYSKMSENYQKFFSKINQNNQNAVSFKPANFDISNTVKKNDLIKILSKVNGTEKLIETIKNGYNESLRELLFENSALKNFILEINNEIIEYALRLDLKGMVTLERNFINMPFLDAIPKIKYALKTNINKSFDFWNLDENKGNNAFDDKTKLNFKDDNIASNILINKQNTSSIFNQNRNININESEKILKKDNENIPIDSISLIRGKNDSIFENENSENHKYKNSFNNSPLKNNQEKNSFENFNYEHMIDFDLDNFDLNDSNSNSTKINRKNESENKDKIRNQTGIESKNDSLPNKITNINPRNEKVKSEINLIDDELEFLKEKWMKALSG